MTVQIDIGPAVNARWAQADRGRRVTVAPLVRAGGGALLRPDSRVFAIGSCFAMEIRQALRARGLAVYPDWSDLPLDDDVQVARHPERESINHYDTFVLRQEIHRARGGLHFGDYWHFENGDPAYALRRWPSFWRDPHRSRVTARTRGALDRITGDISRRIDDGLRLADVVIITLGLTEAWRIDATGRWACQGPAKLGDATHGLLSPHLVTYDENVANLRHIVDLLHPRDVVLTVSPVPLGRTWTAQDVVVANATSKATLRTAATAIVAAHDHVHYWPSWEIATAWHDGGQGAAGAAGGDCFVADARHVRPTVVQAIVDGFLAASMAA